MACNINSEQLQAVELALSGHSFLLTGKAGEFKLS